MDWNTVESTGKGKENRNPLFLSNYLSYSDRFRYAGTTWLESTQSPLHNRSSSPKFQTLPSRYTRDTVERSRIGDRYRRWKICHPLNRTSYKSRLPVVSCYLRLTDVPFLSLSLPETSIFTIIIFSLRTIGEKFQLTTPFPKVRKGARKKEEKEGEKSDECNAPRGHPVDDEDEDRRRRRRCRHCAQRRINNAVVRMPREILYGDYSVVQK